MLDEKKMRFDDEENSWKKKTSVIKLNDHVTSEKWGGGQTLFSLQQQNVNKHRQQLHHSANHRTARM